MKKLYKLLIFTFLLVQINVYSQVKIIFDTDFGGDADDLGALAMLNNFIDKGEINLLAVMCWSTEKYAVSGIDAVNRFYGHDDIPIGTRKDEIHITDWNYSKPIVEKHKYKLDQNTAEDAIKLYRKILAEHEDRSIKIVTVGPLKNIENLLNSAPDEISDLNGKELIEKKVNEFVIMGGKFPEGEKEWNFDGAMPGVTKNVIQDLTVPITFSGFELGVQIKTGEVFNEIDKSHPLYIGFKYFSEHAPWINEYYKGEILDNSTYDQTAVLYAIRGGIGEYWNRVVGGYCLPDSVGGNKWIEGEETNHSYLKLIMDLNEIEEILEGMMLNKF